MHPPLHLRFRGTPRRHLRTRLPLPRQHLLSQRLQCDLLRQKHERLQQVQVRWAMMERCQRMVMPNFQVVEEHLGMDQDPIWLDMEHCLFQITVR
jgi:hypothetical protein